MRGQSSIETTTQGSQPLPNDHQTDKVSNNKRKKKPPIHRNDISTQKAVDEQKRKDTHNVCNDIMERDHVRRRKKSLKVYEKK